MTLLTPPPSGSADAGDLGGWRPRSDADLLAAQLRALDEWHRRRTAPPVVPGQSREARLDEARRRDVADREREALHGWADVMQREEFSGKGATPRAVLAHRNEWLREKLCETLRDRGVDVVASTDDGAEAAAAIVMEQPDLVFIEDLLPSLSGLELTRRTHLYAPDALVGVHALGPDRMSQLLEAGARAAFSRRIPPAQIARELVDCLHSPHRTSTSV